MTLALPQKLHGLGRRPHSPVMVFCLQAKSLHPNHFLHHRVWPDSRPPGGHRTIASCGAAPRAAALGQGPGPDGGERQNTKHKP